MSRPWTRRMATGVLVAIFMLGVAEAALRVTGFRFETGLAYMRFNFPSPHELHNIFQPDPDLLWRMRPGYDFGRGFSSLNSQGFRGPEFSAKKKEGALRVACLGDSVTFGRPEAAYTSTVSGLLDDELGRPVEAMNFGVPGYSSLQGLRLLRKVLEEYKPDVVVILFGWNDHWLAKGYTDKEQLEQRTSSKEEKIHPLQSLRLYQLVHKGVSALGLALKQPPKKLRVPPGQYSRNLASMIEECKRAGAVPVLATSPSAIPTGKVPDFLTHLGFINPEDDLSKLHNKYNQAVRDIAKERAAALVDLDLIFKSHGVTKLFDEPEKDLIHPNKKGYGLIGKSIANSIEEELER